MKKFIILLLTPVFGLSQVNIGSNQTVCLNDTAQIIATFSGSAIGCSGISDSLQTQVAGGNGSAGTIFNVINTSGSPLEITGISQGGTYVMNNDLMEVWVYAGDIYASVLPVGVPPYPGWNLVGSANVNTTGTSNSFGYIPVTGVTIPVGGTYSFRVQRMTSGSVSYTNGIGTAGVSTWASDPNITITEGHGGGLTDWFAFSPRCFNGMVHYGGGASWIDLSTGMTIGSGDTLNYSPNQSTNVCATIDCNGNTFSDTIFLEVLNTNISTTGFSLCNGPVILTASSSGFTSYNWNTGSISNLLTVNNPGIYHLEYLNSTGLSCLSDTITIYQNIIPINLSPSDSVFICQGDTLLIEGPSGFNQYNWNTGEITSSIIVSNPGNYSLSIVDDNGCTGNSDVTSVSISPQIISATTSGYSLCNGPVILDAGPGYLSYQWYNNGMIITNATNQTFSANVQGNYSVEVTYPTGCTANSTPITIFSASSQFYFSINTLGEDSLCMPNGQMILDAGNFSSYSWSTGETTRQINVNSLGSFYVNVTDANGCQGVSNPPFIVSNIVNTSNINGPLTPTQFNLVNYYVSSTSGSSYLWDIIGGNIQSGQGTNSVDVIWDNSGMFSFNVTETDADGCVGEEVSILVDVLINSIEDVNNENNLYKIYDMLGRIVYKKQDSLLFYLYEDGSVKRNIIIKE
tara:strand:- start:3836 stop:5893 length:2058 start_codon:yes stop_codon:yes gene_type:complete